MNKEHIQRLPAEQYFSDELKRLRAQDNWPKPPGWLMSPKGVETLWRMGDDVQFDMSERA